MLLQWKKEKKYFYSANYEGLANLFYDEILKKEFNANDIWFTKTKLIQYGLPKYLEEALLSLKKNLPQTSIRQLLIDLAKTIDVDDSKINFGNDAKGDRITANFIIAHKRYQKIQSALLHIYIQNMEPKSKSKTFEKFKEGLKAE
mgnify:FL=1